MVDHGKATLSISRSGCVVYLHAGLVNDSKFPFKPEDNLRAVLDGNRLIIEKVVEDQEHDAGPDG